MKLNNRGFMMAEVVVVSAVVLITLTTLYISYNKIISMYKTRLTYDDVTTLYKLNYYKDRFLIKTEGQNILNDDVINLSSNNYLSSYDFLCTTNCKENIFIIYNNKNKKIDKDSLSSFTINKAYKEYIDYLSDAVDFTDIDYVMLMEYCDNSNMNCKYAYLELEKEA